MQEELSGTLGVSQDQTLIAFGPYQKTIGPLCATDYKGIRNETLDADKIILQPSNPRPGGPSGKPPVVIEMTSTKNLISDDGIVPTMTARMGTGGNQVHAVCVGNGQMDNITMASVANTLDTMHDQQAVMTSSRCSSIVRRLTPIECERLQGFPDGWTSGDWTDTKGKRHKEASSPRYRALGNSIALPWWRWLMRRISACYARTATLGSLFDGIGGFPLCWSLANGPRSVLWASEIEEFPIAVTTKHFGDEDKGIEGDLWQVLSEQEGRK